MVAEISHHLDQPLLGRGAGQGATRRSAKQPLPCEAEHGVVLRRRPGEITVFKSALHGGVLAFDRPDPEPGQNDVYGEIGHPRGAQEGLRLLEPG